MQKPLIERIELAGEARSPLPLASLHATAGWGTVRLGDIAEHFLKRALVDYRNETQGKEEHLLSWPFLGKIPEAARIGNR